MTTPQDIQAALATIEAALRNPARLTDAHEALSTLRHILQSNEPKASTVDAEALKREIYIAHVKSFIDENEADEYIAQELSLNPDWEWGYNHGCKQAVDDGIDELVRRGMLKGGGV